jgi:hypothetical protein
MTSNPLLVADAVLIAGEATCGTDRSLEFTVVCVNDAVWIFRRTMFSALG